MEEDATGDPAMAAAFLKRPERRDCGVGDYSNCDAFQEGARFAPQWELGQPKSYGLNAYTTRDQENHTVQKDPKQLFF